MSSPIRFRVYEAIKPSGKKMLIRGAGTMRFLFNLGPEDKVEDNGIAPDGTVWRRFLGGLTDDEIRFKSKDYDYVF